VSVPPSSGAPLFRMPSAEDPVLPVHLSWMRGRVRGFINAEPRGRTLSLKKRTRHRSTAFRSQLRSISVRFDRPDATPIAFLRDFPRGRLRLTVPLRNSERPEGVKRLTGARVAHPIYLQRVPVTSLRAKRRTKINRRNKIRPGTGEIRPPRPLSLPSRPRLGKAGAVPAPRPREYSGQSN